MQSVFAGTDVKISPETDVLTDLDSLVKYAESIQSISSTTLANILFLQLATILIGDTTNVIEYHGLSKMENYRRKIYK